MLRRVRLLGPTLAASLTAALLFALLVGPSPISAGEGGIAGARFSAALNGPEETPPVATAATGEFELTLVDSGTLLYNLTYRGFEGGDPLFAHIHVGPPGVAGPVVVFLCGGGGKPSCPAAGSVSGTITAADVMAAGDVGVVAGDLNRVLREIWPATPTPTFTTRRIPAATFAVRSISGRRPERGAGFVSNLCRAERVSTTFALVDCAHGTEN